MTETEKRMQSRARAADIASRAQKASPITTSRENVAPELRRLGAGKRSGEYNHFDRLQSGRETL